MFRGRLLYLSEDLCAFALFDNNISSKTKKKMNNAPNKHEHFLGFISTTKRLIIHPKNAN